jgi:hypothetical protein
MVFRRRAESVTETSDKSISEDGKEPDYPGGVLTIKLSWQESKLFEPQKMINPQLMEPETAKEMLGPCSQCCAVTCRTSCSVPPINLLKLPNAFFIANTTPCGITAF